MTSSSIVSEQLQHCSYRRLGLTHRVSTARTYENTSLFSCSQARCAVNNLNVLVTSGITVAITGTGTGRTPRSSLGQISQRYRYRPNPQSRLASSPRLISFLHSSWMFQLQSADLPLQLQKPYYSTRPSLFGGIIVCTSSLGPLRTVRTVFKIYFTNRSIRMAKIKEGRFRFTR